MKVLGEIDLSCKVISLDFDKNAKFVQINTADHDYIVYDIKDLKNAKKVKASSE